MSKTVAPKDDTKAMAMLAEAVSEGAAPRTAGKRLGMSEFRATALWMRICASVGEAP